MAAFTLAVASPAGADEVLPGPIEARVLRVIDGDSFVAEAHIWPGQKVTVNVRLRGINAPEIRTRCGIEKEAGERSRAALKALIGDQVIQIRNVGGGKYYGRVLADVTTGDGKPVAPRMLKYALASTYSGGARKTACG